MKPQMQTTRYRRHEDGTRSKVVTVDGIDGFIARWTDSCTGCYESCDGYPSGRYPVDPKHGCRVGAGCHECGYTGKRRYETWAPFDFAEYERASIAAGVGR